MAARRGFARVAAAAAGMILSTSAAAPARADAVRDDQWHLKSLRIAEANRIADGEGMIVAVLDTGVDAAQPDLKGAVLPGVDAWTKERDGRTDLHDAKHGTGMAAIIAGRGHGPGGSRGIRGVAPKAKILPVGVWPPGALELRGDNVSWGIRYAVAKGADVINISGGGMSDDEVDQAIDFAAEHGVPVVAGIGNVSKRERSAIYPGYDEQVLGIGAVGPDGKHAPVSVVDLAIDFVAPGEDVPTPRRGGGYEIRYGTSISTAVVSGVVALIRQERPELTVRQIYDLLKATAVDRGPRGFDSTYGWGVIDPVAALTAPVPTPSPTGPPTSAPRSPFPEGAPYSGGDTGLAVVVATLVWGSVLTGMGVLIWFLLRRRKHRDDAAPPAGAATAAGRR